MSFGELIQSLPLKHKGLFAPLRALFIRHLQQASRTAATLKALSRRSRESREAVPLDTSLQKTHRIIEFVRRWVAER